MFMLLKQKNCISETFSIVVAILFCQMNQNVQECTQSEILNKKATHMHHFFFFKLMCLRI